MSKMGSLLATMAVATAVALSAASAAPARAATTSRGVAEIEIGLGRSETLTGRIWVLTALRGKPPLRGTQLTSEFKTTGTVSGSSGCNRYAGTYRLSGSQIRFSPRLASTKIACPRPVDLQEAAFLNALRSARSYSVAGEQLTLRSAGGMATLTYKAQSQQLAGTSWTVLAYNNGKQAVLSVLATPKLTAVFGRDGNLTGFAGCNNYNAPYKATAPKISIGPVASTKKECGDPASVMDQEVQYLAALQTAATYRVDSTRMQMRTPAGALAAEFQRR
jgi:heat shock protein HslJ